MTKPPTVLDPDAMLPLLRARVGDIAPHVLVVGDPGRVAKAAGRLGEVREVGSNREYVTVTGTFRGEPVTVASHGVGSAGAAVCFEELCRAGVREIVRAGTAGGLQPSVMDGSVVVATGAVRDEGITPRLVPLAYPAIADPGLTLRLQNAVTGPQVASHAGVVVTSDLFYSLPVLGVDLELWQRAQCVAVEMELSALLVIAAQHHVAAGGIFAIDGNPVAAKDTAMDNYEPDRDIVHAAVDAALDAALTALIAS